MQQCVSIPSTSRTYRDKIYIIKDVLLALSRLGKVNQTTLTTACGMNITKHKKILLELAANEMIIKQNQISGKRTTIVYGPTAKGYEFCKSTLIPFEEAFPRTNKITNDPLLHH